MTSAHAASYPSVPPGPVGHVLHGHSLAFRLGRRAFLSRMIREYGDIVRYRIGCEWNYLINDYHLVPEALTNWDDLDNAVMEDIYLKHSFLAVQGRARAKPRSIAHASMCPRALLGRVDLMARSAVQMGETWQSGESRNLLQDMMVLGLEMLSWALLGKQAQEAIAPSLPDLTDLRVLGGTYRADEKMAERLSDGGRLDVYVKLESAMEDFVQSCPSDPEENIEPMATFFRAERAGVLSHEAVVHEMVASMLANGSTSLLATWVWMALGQHPSVRGRLEAELEAVLGGRVPEAQDLGRLNYLDRVVKETARLYPPVGLIPRRAIRDWSCGPYTVPAGSRVQFSPYLLHRHPGAWPRATTFDPDRFDPDSPSYHAVQKGAYLPFGFGIRQCIGEHLALLQVKLIVATLAQRFRLVLPAGDEPDCDISPMGAMYPDSLDVPVVVEERRAR